MKHQSENVISFQQHKYSQWGNILENSADYRSISQNRFPIKHYTNSLSKKRLLKLWCTFRLQVQIAPQLPAIIERVVYANVYDDLKPLLLESYHEDSNQPYNHKTLLTWLEDLKMTAEELKKEDEMIYWQELLDYFHLCTQFEVIDDFQISN